MEDPPAIPPEAKDKSMLGPAGFFLLCALMLSGYLNDWSFRLLGGKAYLSTICIVLVPAVWLMGGNTMAGFRDRMGVWWLAFLGLMLMGVPFSYWRSESLSMIWTYSFRSLAYYFYIVSFCTTLRRCRTMMLVNIACQVIVLLTCLLFGANGSETDASFRIADSLFLSNSNELALQLLLGISALMFLFYIGGLWKSIFAVAGISASVVYILKTGSRGSLVSALVLFFVVLWVSRRRIQIVVVTLPLVAIGLAVIPASSLHRFTLIFDPDPEQSLDVNESAAVGSSKQRQELLKKGLEYTVTHPIFGIGMGQFAVAYTGDAEKKRQHAPWLGSHNSYTQVSAECGIPAFTCYMAILVLTFRRSWQVYKRAARKPHLQEIKGLAFCLAAGVIVYSIGTFFFHMAYTVLLPLLAGQAVAISRAAEPVLAAAERRRTPARASLDPAPAAVIT
jgi:O-antigen ligase